MLSIFQNLCLNKISFTLVQVSLLLYKKGQTKLRAVCKAEVTMEDEEIGFDGGIINRIERGKVFL